MTRPVPPPSNIEVVARHDPERESEPQVLVIDGARVDVLGIDDRWYDPAANYVKVAASDGRIYLLRCDSEDLRWSAVGAWELDA